MNPRLFWVVGLVAVFILSAPVWLYVWKELTVNALNDQERDELRESGVAYRFANLSRGKVHFRVSGPQGGVPVLLIHGLAAPMSVWDSVAAKLATNGYRVIAFDGYGRGLSSRPNAIYNEDLFDAQNIELLDSLGITEPAEVVGYSAGGVAATVFAARHSERIRSLSLIAPAGLLHRPPAPAWLLQIPGLQHWLGRVVAPWYFYGMIEKSTAALPDGNNLLAQVATQFHYSGSGEAIISMLRNYPLSGADRYFAKAGAQHIPTLILWGESDTAVPFELARKVKHYLPNADLVTVPAAEHNLVYAKPEIVANILLKFIQRGGQ